MKKTLLNGILCAGALLLGAVSVNGQNNTFPTTGNAGIGTTTPPHALTVQSGQIGIMNGDLRVWDYKPNNAGDHGMIYIGQAGNLNFHWKFGELSDNDLYLGRWNNTNGHAASMKIDDASGRISVLGKDWSAVDLGTTPDDNVRLTVRGKVFIGDNATSGMQASLKSTGTGSCPNLKLLVNGTIGATEVRVSTTSWCDYVFDQGYKLKPLNEVESFIKTNKHLPEVPSEKEVVENGMAMGEMMKVHMKKIEELTLYMIELQKQNEKLAAEVARLKK